MRRAMRRGCLGPDPAQGRPVEWAKGGFFLRWAPWCAMGPDGLRICKVPQRKGWLKRGTGEPSTGRLSHAWRAGCAGIAAGVAPGPRHSADNRGLAACGHAAPARRKRSATFQTIYAPAPDRKALIAMFLRVIEWPSKIGRASCRERV